MAKAAAELSKAFMDATHKDTVAMRASLCQDADVEFLCKGDRHVLAHKALLRMASPVWRGLIDGVQDCRTIPAEEDCSQAMELLMCMLYPVLPRVQLQAVSGCVDSFVKHPQVSSGLEGELFRLSLATQSNLLRVTLALRLDKSHLREKQTVHNQAKCAAGHTSASAVMSSG